MLYIQASPKSVEQSASKSLGEFFIETYKKRFPDVFVDRLDLCSEEVPFISGGLAEYLEGKKTELSQDDSEILKISEVFIRRIQEAEAILVSTPMWVFSIPAVLKAFFDLVVIEGKTFSLGSRSPGLVKRKPVVCIISRKGTYSRAPFSEFNVQEKYLKNIFEFIGAGCPEFIVAEGLSRAQNRESIMEISRGRIKEVIEAGFLK